MISDLTLSDCPSVPASKRRNPHLQFIIPAEDATSSVRTVPMESLEEVRALLRAMEEIDSAPKVLPACKQLAASMNRCRGGWSVDRLRARYYEFVRGNNQYSAGSWRILLNKSKARVDNAAVVASRWKFHEFWRTLGESNHQDWAAAHDELLKIFRTGYDNLGRQYTLIPGYEKWPEQDAFYGYPDGWSYANLMRYQSDRYDQVAARIGHAKASEHRLPVLTDRTKIQFGQYIEFDDHHFNQKVLFQSKPMRPLGFGAVELFSGCPLPPGLKPTIWDEDEKAKRMLTEREFMWYVVAVLTTIGYRADIGTELIVERGTAAIKEWFAKRIAGVTNNKVTTFVGGRFGRPAHDGQFSGASKGNYKTKALVEGLWRIIDDQMASLPAQMGRNRDDSPEQLHGAEQYTASLMRQIEARQDAGRPLTPQQLEDLRFAIPMFSTWREWALDAFHRVATDRDHKLQGWEKLGFVQSVWRMPSVDAWMPQSAFTALPPIEQGVVKRMLDENPALVRSVRLNRQEVFNQAAKSLTKVPWELLPGLVGPENALDRPLQPERGVFRFQCATIDSDPLIFYARDGKNFLSDREKYLCFVNPYAPTHLVACTYDSAASAQESLKVVAVCARYERAGRGDQDSVNKLLGEQSSFEAQARVRLNLRHSDEAAAKRAMFDNNARVLGQNDPRGTIAQPANPRLKNFDGDVSDFIPSTSEEVRCGSELQTPAEELNPDGLL